MTVQQLLEENNPSYIYLMHFIFREHFEVIDIFLFYFFYCNKYCQTSKHISSCNQVSQI